MPTTQIPLQPLASSSVRAAGFDAGSGTLAVQFKNGRTYHYEGITAEQYSSLVGAKSVGKAANELLRGRAGTPLESPGEAHERRIRAARPVRTRAGR